ncbi:MAG: response regulator, partial [Rhodanobacter sp.]
MNHDAHILIVDDDENNRFMLVQRLRQLNFQRISEADGGEAALAFIRASAPDLVLLDVMMPGTDGVNVLEVLRQEDRLSNLPVLMVSAHDSIDIAARCIELGAEDYLTKPIQVPLLRARVEAVLERRRLRAVELAFLTHFEPDTGLPNRRALLERVDRLLAVGVRFALVVVACRDHDSIALGAGEADAGQILHVLNRRIQASHLPTDFVAHVGDGMLAWLLPDGRPDHLLLHDVE